MDLSLFFVALDDIINTYKQPREPTFVVVVFIHHDDLSAAHYSYAALGSAHAQANREESHSAVPKRKAGVAPSSNRYPSTATEQHCELMSTKCPFI